MWLTPLTTSLSDYFVYSQMWHKIHAVDPKATVFLRQKNMIKMDILNFITSRYKIQAYPPAA